jgi:hypothetical protein
LASNVSTKASTAKPPLRLAWRRLGAFEVWADRHPSELGARQRRLTLDHKAARWGRGKRRVAGLYSVVHLASRADHRNYDYAIRLIDGENNAPASNTATSNWWVAIHNGPGVSDRVAL